jgi:catalase
MKDKKKYTTSFGSPVDDDQNSITAGPSGPVLIQDVHLVDKLAHFNRERIPERVCTPRAWARSATSRALTT